MERSVRFMSDYSPLGLLSIAGIIRYLTHLPIQSTDKYNYVTLPLTRPMQGCKMILFKFPKPFGKETKLLWATPLSSMQKSIADDDPGRIKTFSPVHILSEHHLAYFTSQPDSLDHFFLIGDFPPVGLSITSGSVTETSHSTVFWYPPEQTAKQEAEGPALFSRRWFRNVSHSLRFSIQADGIQGKRIPLTGIFLKTHNGYLCATLRNDENARLNFYWINATEEQVHAFLSSSGRGNAMTAEALISFLAQFEPQTWEGVPNFSWSNFFHVTRLNDQLQDNSLLTFSVQEGFGVLRLGSLILDAFALPETEDPAFPDLQMLDAPDPKAIPDQDQDAWFTALPDTDPGVFYFFDEQGIKRKALALRPTSFNLPQSIDWAPILYWDDDGLKVWVIEIYNRERETLVRDLFHTLAVETGPRVIRMPEFATFLRSPAYALKDMASPQGRYIPETGVTFKLFHGKILCLPSRDLTLVQGAYEAGNQPPTPPVRRKYAPFTFDWFSQLRLMDSGVLQIHEDKCHILINSENQELLLTRSRLPELVFAVIRRADCPEFYDLVLQALQADGPQKILNERVTAGEMNISFEDDQLQVDLPKKGRIFISDRFTSLNPALQTGVIQLEQDGLAAVFNGKRYTIPPTPPLPPQKNLSKFERAGDSPLYSTAWFSHPDLLPYRARLNLEDTPVDIIPLIGSIEEGSSDLLERDGLKVGQKISFMLVASVHGLPGLRLISLSEEHNNTLSKAVLGMAGTPGQNKARFLEILISLFGSLSVGQLFRKSVQITEDQGTPLPQIALTPNREIPHILTIGQNGVFRTRQASSDTHLVTLFHPLQLAPLTTAMQAELAQDAASFNQTERDRKITIIPLDSVNRTTTLDGEYIRVTSSPLPVSILFEAKGIRYSLLPAHLSIDSSVFIKWGGPARPLEYRVEKVNGTIQLIAMEPSVAGERLSFVPVKGGKDELRIPAGSRHAAALETLLFGPRVEALYEKDDVALRLRSASDPKSALAESFRRILTEQGIAFSESTFPLSESEFPRGWEIAVECGHIPAVKRQAVFKFLKESYEAHAREYNQQALAGLPAWPEKDSSIPKKGTKELKPVKEARQDQRASQTLTYPAEVKKGRDPALSLTVETLRPADGSAPRKTIRALTYKKDSLDPSNPRVLELTADGQKVEFPLALPTEAGASLTLNALLETDAGWERLSVTVPASGSLHLASEVIDRQVQTTPVTGRLTMADGRVGAETAFRTELSIQDHPLRGREILELRLEFTPEDAWALGLKETRLIHSFNPPLAWKQNKEIKPKIPKFPALELSLTWEEEAYAVQRAEARIEWAALAGQAPKLEGLIESGDQIETVELGLEQANGRVFIGPESTALFQGLLKLAGTPMLLPPGAKAELLRDSTGEVEPVPVKPIMGHLPLKAISARNLFPEADAVSSFLRFLPGEALTPTQKQLEKIAARKFIPGMTYEVELQSLERGIIYTFTAKYWPDRTTAHWSLDAQTPIRARRFHERRNQAVTLNDPNITLYDNGGDWLALLTKQNGETVKLAELKCFRASPAIPSLFNALNQAYRRGDAGSFKEDAKQRTYQAIASAWGTGSAQWPTPKIYGNQEILPAPDKTLRIRFSGEGNPLYLEGLRLSANGEHYLLEDRLTLRRTNAQGTEETILLVPTGHPNDPAACRLQELNERGQTLRVMDWYPQLGQLILRPNYSSDAITDQQARAWIGRAGVPLLASNGNGGAKTAPTEKSDKPKRAWITDYQDILELPADLQGYVSPDLNRARLLTDPEELKKWAEHLSQQSFTLDEESLSAHLYGDRSQEPMVVLDESGNAFQFSMVRDRNNPKNLLFDQAPVPDSPLPIRIFVRDKSGHLELPASFTAIRTRGTTTFILRLDDGKDGITLKFKLRYSQQTANEQPVFALIPDSADQAQETAALARLEDSLDFFGIKKGQPPLEMAKVMAQKNENGSFRPDGISYERDDQGQIIRSYINTEESGQTREIDIYRSPRNSADFYLFDPKNLEAGGQNLKISLEDWKRSDGTIRPKGTPIAWSRQPADKIQQFLSPPPASSVKMAGILVEEYESASRFGRFGKNGFRGAFGRERGASDGSIHNDQSGRAMLKFEIEREAGGKFRIKEGSAYIKQIGPGKIWMPAETDMEYRDDGTVGLYFRGPDRESYHDFIWLECANAQTLLDDETPQILRAQYNQTNRKTNAFPREGIYPSLVTSIAHYDERLGEALATSLKEREADILAFTEGETGYGLLESLLFSLGYEKQSRSNWNRAFLALYKITQASKKAGTLAFPKKEAAERPATPARRSRSASTPGRANSEPIPVAAETKANASSPSPRRSRKTAKTPGTAQLTPLSPMNFFKLEGRGNLMIGDPISQNRPTWVAGKTQGFGNEAPQIEASRVFKEVPSQANRNRRSRINTRSVSARRRSQSRSTRSSPSLRRSTLNKRRAAFRTRSSMARHRARSLIR